LKDDVGDTGIRQRRIIVQNRDAGDFRPPYRRRACASAIFVASAIAAWVRPSEAPSGSCSAMKREALVLSSAGTRRRQPRQAPASAITTTASATITIVTLRMFVMQADQVWHRRPPA
jgi:hypothetical protein